jgi:hypothetical protein
MQMRRLAAFILFSASCWAQCNSPATYTVGTGKQYPATTGIADALAAISAACGYHSPFGAAQTISVYAAGGPYSAPGTTWPLLPTVANPLLITAAPGESPVINCGGSTAYVLQIEGPYHTFTGFEVTACGGIYSDYNVGGATTISYNYIHDMAGSSGAINPNGPQTNWWVHHNRIVNVPTGINVGGNALIEYNEVGPTTGSSATQIACGSEGVSCTERNNYVYGAGAQPGSAIWNYSAASVYGNVSQSNRYGNVVETTSSGDTVTASHNIMAYPSNFGCHCEGGSGACWESVDHALCIGVSTSAGGIPVVLGSTAASSLSFTSSISWADSTPNLAPVYNVDANVGTIYSDYNVFNKVSGLNTAISTGPVLYATLANWQATGNDTHTVQVDPRFVGSVGLLNTSARVFLECPTIECRLGKIRHNYTPTNLALKGAGCAWNGTTCVPDHSDIGPVPVTVYDAPGMTGGGVY